MSILVWDKPPKTKTTEEHNDYYIADSAPPGVYVPNMSVEWQKAWKAKKIGGTDPRVEIRKSTNGVQALIVVRRDGQVQMSMNGKATFDITELATVLSEALDYL